VYFIFIYSYVCVHFIVIDIWGVHLIFSYSCGGVLFIVSDSFGGVHFIVSYNCGWCTLLLVTVEGCALYC